MSWLFFSKKEKKSQKPEPEPEEEIIIDANICKERVIEISRQKQIQRENYEKEQEKKLDIERLQIINTNINKFKLQIKNDIDKCINGGFKYANVRLKSTNLDYSNQDLYYIEEKIIPYHKETFKILQNKLIEWLICECKFLLNNTIFN